MAVYQLEQPLYLDERRIFAVENIEISIASALAVPFEGMYYCNPGDEINITAELHADGDIVAGLTIPAIIKMPIVRHANGKPTDDEMYLNVILNNGVMTTTGNIPRSGDWKILTSRINNALLEIKADWKLDTPDVTFIA